MAFFGKNMGEQQMPTQSPAPVNRPMRRNPGNGGMMTPPPPPTQPPTRPGGGMGMGGSMGPNNPMKPPGGFPGQQGPGGGGWGQPGGSNQSPPWAPPRPGVPWGNKAGTETQVGSGYGYRPMPRPGFPPAQGAPPSPIGPYGPNQDYNPNLPFGGNAGLPSGTGGPSLDMFIGSQSLPGDSQVWPTGMQRYGELPGVPYQPPPGYDMRGRPLPGTPYPPGTTFGRGPQQPMPSQPSWGSSPYDIGMPPPTPAQPAPQAPQWPGGSYENYLRGYLPGGG